MAGAKLVVTDDLSARAAGTLGGGCVEADAIDAAREVIAQGGQSLRAYELTEELAWNTGLVCGGTMWILAERGTDALDAGGRSMLPALVDAATGGTPIAIVTRLRRRGRDLAYAGRLFVDAAGRVTGTFGEAPPDSRLVTMAVDQLRHGTPRVVTLDDEHEVLIEPVAPRPRLVVAGGGHVALAIARQAQLLDFDVTILEDRPEFADPSRFGGATVLQGDVPTTIASLDYGWNSYLVVATRGHKLDADCVLAAAGTNVNVHRPARQPAQDRPHPRHAARARHRRRAHPRDSRAGRPRPRRPHAGGNRALGARRDHAAALPGHRAAVGAGKARLS